MRITHVTLRNCRIHRELKVEFDSARTLIGGPNEVGKSTLVEAIHRAFFLKAKGKTENHRAMQSSIHLGHPEVEISFEAGGSVYQLKKRFGTNGSTTLTSASAASLSGDAAEEELARLLSVEPGVAGKAMSGQWAHLWVWQGCAGDDPLTHATTHRDSLVQRLQGNDLSAALQSELDARVAGEFVEAANSIFTQSGKPKAGSDLEKAESAAAVAEEERNRAASTFARLEAAASEVENVTLEIPRVEQSLKLLETQQAALDSRERDLIRLRQTETEQTFHATSALQTYDALSRAEANIIGKRQSVQKLEEELKPKQNRIAEIGKTRESARAESEQAEKDYRAAAETVRRARLRRDLATAWRRSFETGENLAKLTGKQKRVADLKSELQASQKAQAQLPRVDKDALIVLQKLEAKSGEARTALDAMAAGLEVVAADQTVKTGDRILATGQKLILTEDAEIVVGEMTRLRITPGGGKSLADARKSEAELRERLHREFASLGITSTLEAVRTVERRSEINAKIDAIHAAMNGMGAETLEQELATAQAERSSAQADVARLAAMIENPPVPENTEQAVILERSLRESLSASETAESEAKARRDTGSRKAADAESQWNTERAAIQAETRQLNNLLAELAVLIESHGDDEVRSGALGRAKAAKEEADRMVQATRASIALLQPELLPGDRDRLTRATAEKLKEKEGLRERLAAAKASLRLDGDEDPKTARDGAEMRAQIAREYRDSVKRRSEALALLKALFEEERASLAEQFTRPLEQKISDYLGCIFGPGARARMELDGNQFSALGLSRPLRDNAMFDFSTLSGGAREQVAAAVRLALAEVLAADHDGCLPVVFDDAFAYSDPDRVNKLQRMLDLAATRGLQIIILTCNSADYAALGARNVTLCVERPAPREIQIVTDAGLLPGVSEDPEQAFIVALQDSGGSSGNLALRQSLGWDEATYEAIKNRLVTADKVRLGRGKGGSVSLSGAE